MVTVDEITKELEKVVDPEIGLPITEMHLVDEIDIKEDGVLFIKYHLTAPFCPPIFAEDIGMNIRQLTSKLDGVKKVTVILHGHALANEINQRVNLTTLLRLRHSFPMSVRFVYRNGHGQTLLRVRRCRKIGPPLCSRRRRDSFRKVCGKVLCP